MSTLYAIVSELDISLDETDTTRMRPGMRFRGRIETERVAEALVVPKQAVFTGADGPVVYRRTLMGHEAVLVDRKSTRLNSSHMSESRMPSSA